MSIKSRAALTALAICVATPLLAFGSADPRPNLSRPTYGVDVAQTTARVLTDSEIRRINHYSAQAMDVVLAFGVAGGSTDIDILRQKVHRLIDAGKRSGMSLVQVADYFEAYMNQNANAPVPGPFLDAAGQFDARTLLSSVQLHRDNAAPQEVDVAAVDAHDLEGVRSVAQRLAAAPVETNLQLSVVTSAPDAVIESHDGPTIPADAPANVRSILERVHVKGGQWVITVVPGDSLGQYANALYGDSLLFRQIYDANLDVMSTPNVIEVGQELVLPHG
jgi:hypothetical protein